MVGTRVLVADDDARLAELISRYLTMEGYEVETVADGLVAVERAIAEPPGLVVLDIMMPGIDGLEACRRIRANLPTAELPVLVVSALGDEDEPARRAGADATLKKPFALPVLGRAVERLTAR
jgi:DNA-binding response OmpR family regulator